MDMMPLRSTMPSHPLMHRPVRHQDPLILVATRRIDSRREDLEDDLVDALLAEAGARGWRLLDLNLTEGSLSGERAPAGAMVTMLPDDPEAEALRRLGIPMVRLGRLPHPADATMPAVLPDLAEAGRMAAEYFARRGFKHVGLVGHRDMMMVPLIDEGFGEKAEASGCTVHRHMFESDVVSGGGRQATASRYDRRARKLTEWLATVPKPVGLFACQSAIAGMVNIMCRRAGLAVPEDVALLATASRRAACEMGPVPISSVEVSRPDLGRAAMRLLDDLIHHRPIPPRTLIPPRRIVTRRSTEILAVGHPLVARAIRFMWDHLHEPLSVGDVAIAMRTPRYKLERLFRRHLDRGVNAELRRARLQRFCDLLRGTDLTVDELTRQVGYRSAKRLHVAFRETFGLTPRQYRLQYREADAEAEAEANSG